MVSTSIISFYRTFGSTLTRIHNTIVFIDTSNNASYNQVHWLVGTPYLAMKASNEIHK